MAAEQSPIFSKTYDFTLWLLNHTEKYPKSERFRMARRLEDAVFDLHERFLRAARSKNPAVHLDEADLLLDKLRYYVRLSHQRKLMAMNQYEFAAKSLVEIGKLLGGWKRAII